MHPLSKHLLRNDYVILSILELEIHCGTRKSLVIVSPKRLHSERCLSKSGSETRSINEVAQPMIYFN